MQNELEGFIHKNIFTIYLSVDREISLPPLEQVRFMKQNFKRYFSYNWADDGCSIFRNVASLNIPFHELVNLLYYREFY